MVRTLSEALTPGWMMSLFLTINVICYLDRGIIPGAPTSFTAFIASTMRTEETGALFGLLNSIFIVGYSAASIAVGHLVHLMPPMRVIGYGLAIHALAVLGSGLSYYTQSYWCLLIARCISGVGEASFCSIAPTFIDDKVPAQWKGRCMSLFYVAIPVGIGSGYIFAGAMATHWGWQWAFFLQLIPFIPCTVLCFCLDELQLNHQARQQEEGPSMTVIGEEEGKKARPAVESPPDNGTLSLSKDLKSILSSPLYVMTVLGEAAFSFVFAGLAAFAPGLVLDLGFFVSEAEGSLYFGLVTTLSGIAGSVLGGLLFDRFSNALNPGPNLSVGLAQQAFYGLFGFFIMMFLPWASSASLFFLTVFLGLSVCTSSFTPTLFVIVRTVPVRARSLAIGLQNVLLHVLGDVPSPVLIGALKDAMAPSNMKVPGTNRYSPEGLKRLRETCLIVICWLGWMAAFWVGAYIFYRKQMPKKVRQARQMASV